ncbi:MAG: aspartate/glutamate racemase family protein [Burkholderiaceae bacterium]|nr:aspartate/glutamate racemase family protein [Burkholderiaceae bacterium]
MKTIGLIGGISWESTVPYYRLLNEAVKHRLGGLHSAKLVLYSVDFDEVAHHQHSGNWTAAGEIMVRAARAIEAAGADFIVICANTMHKLVPEVEAAVAIPVLHVADMLAARLKQAGAHKVGLLATRFTMEHDFYRARLEGHGFEVIVPSADDRETVHRVIYEELCQGQVRDASRLAYRAVIKRLVEAGVDSIALACTEIAMLIGEEDSPVPLFDTTEIHALAAVDFALSDYVVPDGGQPC